MVTIKVMTSPGVSCGWLSVKAWSFSSLSSIKPEYVSQCRNVMLRLNLLHVRVPFYQKKKQLMCGKLRNMVYDKHCMHLTELNNSGRVYCYYQCFINSHFLPQCLWTIVFVCRQKWMPPFSHISQNEPVGSTPSEVVIYSAQLRLKTCHPNAERGINQRL